MISVKDRYSGFQTLCGVMKDEACHYLVLCSIADEYLITHGHQPHDFLGILRLAQSKRWITKDFWVSNDGTPILEAATGKKWQRKEVVSLPVIRDNDYTEAIYYNPNTDLHHYRRRGFDTLEYSKTVAEGYVEKYYIYTVEE